MDGRAEQDQFNDECEALGLDPAQTTSDDLKREKALRASRARRECAWAKRQAEEEGAQHKSPPPSSK